MRLESFWLWAEVESMALQGGPSHQFILASSDTIPEEDLCKYAIVTLTLIAALPLALVCLAVPHFPLALIESITAPIAGTTQIGDNFVHDRPPTPRSRK